MQIWKYMLNLLPPGLFKFPGYSANHPEGFVAFIAVLVFFIRIHQGKIPGFQGCFLTFFIHKGAFTFYNDSTSEQLIYNITGNCIAEIAAVTWV